MTGHDGWLTNGGSGAAGVLNQASVEVVEQQQPVLVERLEVGLDSGGPGRWDGAPGAYCVYRARQDAVRRRSAQHGSVRPGDRPGHRIDKPRDALAETGVVPFW